MGKISVYSNAHGTNITYETGTGTHMSWHSNENSDGKPLFSYKTADGQYSKKYDSNGRAENRGVFKGPKK